MIIYVLNIFEMLLIGLFDIFDINSQFIEFVWF